MRTTLPAKSPPITDAQFAESLALGEQIRARRKALRVSAVAAAQSAGMSRVTWHRIERGEPSVTMGAYASATRVLGLSLELRDTSAAAPQATPTAPGGQADWIPVRIRLADYPQLKGLAWHVHGVAELTPAEALGIYERNARHLDVEAMPANERQLLSALRLALRDEPKPVV